MTAGRLDFNGTGHQWGCSCVACRTRGPNVADDDLAAHGLRRCLHCNCNGEVNAVALPDRTVWLHRECEAPWMEKDGGR
jgi:hypothetical protein